VRGVGDVDDARGADAVVDGHGVEAERELVELDQVRVAPDPDRDRVLRDRDRVPREAADLLNVRVGFAVLDLRDVEDPEVPVDRIGLVERAALWLESCDPDFTRPAVGGPASGEDPAALASATIHC
jgi:hypothetical protein